MKHHFARTTMMESMPLISTGFNRVGNVLEKLGLGGVGRAYKVIAEIADAAQLIYELVNELNQADALEKGARELVKRTKPVKKIADKLIRKKFPNMPEPIRNEVSKQLEDLFEKYFSDPQIKKGKKALQEVDDNKDLNRSLYEELRRMQKKLTIPLAPVSSPASLP
jgi:hypothetical protein